MWINDETQSHIKEVISMRTVTRLKNRDLFMENSTISVNKAKSWICWQCGIVSRVDVVHSLCPKARFNSIRAVCLWKCHTSNI